MNPILRAFIWFLALGLCLSVWAAVARLIVGLWTLGAS